MNPRKLIKQNEKGAVLLTTLLVMSIMATVAVNVMDDVRFALKRTANVQAYTQADWYINGAEDFAQNYLQSLIGRLDPSVLNTALLQAEPVILPIEGGAITLRARDGGDCLSLSDIENAAGRRLFRQLLEATGWDTLSAANFTSVAADWVDSDSQALPGGAEDFVYLGRTPAYRTSNSSFTAVSELRALSGMDEDKFQALRPYVCARDDAATAINIDAINITQAPVLAAVLGGAQQLTLAQSLINARPPEGYQSLETLNASPLLSEAQIDAEAAALIAFSPRYIWVEIDVSYLNITRHAVIEFSNNDGNLSPVFRRLSKDEARPTVLESET